MQHEWRVLDHLPQPSDFHLFTPLKGHLAGKRFASDSTMLHTVISLLKVLDTYFFHNRIDSLAPQWDTCLQIWGNYVEKWYVPKFLVHITCHTCIYIRVSPLHRRACYLIFLNSLTVWIKENRFYRSLTVDDMWLDPKNPRHYFEVVTVS